MPNLRPPFTRQELRRVAEEELTVAEGMLSDEAAQDGELRVRHGPTWNRPASTALNSSLREKLGSYRFFPPLPLHFISMDPNLVCFQVTCCRVIASSDLMCTVKRTSVPRN